MLSCLVYEIVYCFSSYVLFLLLFYSFAVYYSCSSLISANDLEEKAGLANICDLFVLFQVDIRRVGKLISILHSRNP